MWFCFERENVFVNSLLFNFFEKKLIDGLFMFLFSIVERFFLLKNCYFIFLLEESGVFIF